MDIENCVIGLIIVVVLIGACGCGVYLLIKRRDVLGIEVPITLIICGLFGTLIMSWAGASFLINTHNPFDEGLCKYRSYDSTYEFLIHDTCLDIWEDYIYYDEFYVEETYKGYNVTITGYWYVDGFKWCKDEGQLEFFTRHSFCPIPQRVMPDFELK